MKNKFIKFIEKPKLVILTVLAIAFIAAIFIYINVGRPPEISLGDDNLNNPISSGYKEGDDISLAFPKSGRVSNVYVKTGDVVKKGQKLANLDFIDAQGLVNQAKGALDIAQANYEKILNGATGSDIDVLRATVLKAQSNFDKTKETQNILVNNAYNNLLNSSLEAVPENGTSDYVAPIISGNYNLGKEGTIKLTSYYSVGGTSFTASGLTSGSGIANSITSQPLGDSGLYIKFPSTTNINVTDWVINIPNKKAANYLTNLNTYESALAQEKSAVDQASANLAIKKSVARSSDIDLAKADILSAQGQLEGAQANYDNTIIKAPSNGTITKIDIKTGELTSALKEALVLQDVSNIYLETNINEANITSLSVGMPIDINFDSFGADKIFKGNITKIDPASTLVSGVVNYKVTASVEKVPDLRPGMTANMTIKAKEKDHILTVPSRAILVNKDGTKTIRLVTNTKLKSYKEVPITTGLEGDGGLVEVASGLSEGDEYVVLIKK